MKINGNVGSSVKVVLPALLLGRTFESQAFSRFLTCVVCATTEFHGVTALPRITTHGRLVHPKSRVIHQYEIPASKCGVSIKLTALNLVQQTVGSGRL